MLFLSLNKSGLFKCPRWITKMIRELLALLITGMVDLLCKAVCKVCKKPVAEPTVVER